MYRNIRSFYFWYTLNPHYFRLNGTDGVGQNESQYTVCMYAYINEYNIRIDKSIDIDTY